MTKPTTHCTEAGVRMCGRGISRPEHGRKGYQDILERRSAKDDQGGCHISAYYVLMTTSCVEVPQRGRDVEIPSTPQRPAADRSVNVGESALYGVRPDGEWKY